MGYFSGRTSLEDQFRNLDGSPSDLKNSQTDNHYYNLGGPGNAHGTATRGGWFESRTNGPRVIKWSTSFMVGTDENPPINLGLSPQAAETYWANAAFKIKNLLEMSAQQLSRPAAKRPAARRASKKVPFRFPMPKALPVQKVKKTPAKTAFCKKMLRQVKGKSAKQMKALMKSCIMDGEFPELSKAIVKTIKRVRKQSKSARKALKKVVRSKLVGRKVSKKTAASKNRA